MKLKEPTSGRESRTRSPARAAEERFAYSLLAPAIMVLVGLVVIPLVWNILIGFQSLRLIDLRNFGPLTFLEEGLTLDNFRTVLNRPDFWQTVQRTGLYAFLGTLGSLVLGLWAALAMRQPFRGRGLVRSLLLLPYVVPVIAATFTWRTMLSPQFGVINAWLGAAGIERIDFFGTSRMPVEVLGLTIDLPVSFMMIIVFETWRYFPFAYIFIQARMQAIPATLYEAARVDGASIVQQFRHVTLPALSGVLALLFLLRFIWNFNDFTHVFLLTGGAGGTRVIAIEIYEWLIARNNPGAAAAVSLVLAAVLVIGLALYFRFFGRREIDK